MDHLAAPLEELRARACAWLPDETSRFLRVDVDAELLAGARRLVSALEWVPDNRRPFFELAGTGSWDARAAALRAAYEVRVAAFLGQGIELPALPAPPPGAGGLGDLAACLARVARVFDDPALGTRGVVVVAGPVTGEVGALAAARGLERVRWIWLEAHAGGAAGGPADLAASLGPGVSTAACRIDRAAQKREIDELLAAMISMISTTGGGGAGAGGVPGAARPRSGPPPHPSDPPGGAAPGGAAALPHLRPLLLAVQAARAVGPGAALPLLRQARDGAAAAGLGVEAAEMEVLLGAFVAGAALARGGSVRHAAPVFESAVARAESVGATAAGAKARFFLGAAAASNGEVQLAGQSLLAAAEQARRAGDPLLACHALRIAGELATDVGLHARGAELRAEAVQVAEGLGPGLVVSAIRGPT